MKVYDQVTNYVGHIFTGTPLLQANVFIRWCQIEVPDCPRCQIVRSAKLSAVPNCLRCQIVLGAKFSGVPNCSARLSAVPNCPQCQIVLSAKFSGVPNCLGCQIVWCATLSAVPNCPRCQIIRGVKLSAVPNCPRSQIVRVPNCPDTKLSQDPWSSTHHVFCDGESATERMLNGFLEGSRGHIYTQLAVILLRTQAEHPSTLKPDLVTKWKEFQIVCLYLSDLRQSCFPTESLINYFLHQVCLSGYEHM